MYINTTTLVQTTEAEIRADNPNTSFPNPFVAPEGYALVFPSPQPELNSLTQRAQAFIPESTSKGTWEQRWQVIELYETQAERDAAISAAVEVRRVNERQAAKAEREVAVAALTVTTSQGHVFDGDETSQNRMARAILALQGAGQASTLWVLNDNTAIDVTVAELTEALALAGAAQSAIWVIE